MEQLNEIRNQADFRHLYPLGQIRDKHARIVPTDR